MEIEINIDLNIDSHHGLSVYGHIFKPTRNMDIFEKNKRKFISSKQYRRTFRSNKIWSRKSTTKFKKNWCSGRAKTTATRSLTITTRSTTTTTSESVTNKNYKLKKGVPTIFIYNHRHQ